VPQHDRETEASIVAFFDAYRLAFQNFDTAALARRFAYPVQLTTDDGAAATVVTSEATYVEAIDPLLRSYRELGISDGEIVSLSTSVLSESLAQAFIDWNAREAGGAIVYNHQANYTLVRREGDWRIVAIALNEMSRLRASLKARRAAAPR
jgi:hypothetical protein